MPFNISEYGIDQSIVFGGNKKLTNWNGAEPNCFPVMNIKNLFQGSGEVQNENGLLYL